MIASQTRSKYFQFQLTFICLCQAGIVPGKMTKICPHTSTGRADYFGSAVNRAARLLCAAKAGQVLVEEHIMDGVITEWRGGRGKVKGMQPGDVKHSGLIPANAGSSNRLQARGNAGFPRPEGMSVSLDEPAKLGKRSRSVPLATIRRLALTGRASPSEQTASNIDFVVPASVSSGGSSDAGDGEPEDAYCAPYASQSPLACSNCHMLRFLAASGQVVGRREIGTFRSNAYRSLASKKHVRPLSLVRNESTTRQLLSSAGNSLAADFDLSTVGTLPSPVSSSKTPNRGLDTVPHKVAWQDGISFQMAKHEEHAATGDKQARHTCMQYCLSIRSLQLDLQVLSVKLLAAIATSICCNLEVIAAMSKPVHALHQVKPLCELFVNRAWQTMWLPLLVCARSCSS